MEFATDIGGSGQMLAFDMGEPGKIVDLVRQVIHLAGHREDVIGIQLSGAWPGGELFDVRRQWVGNANLVDGADLRLQLRQLVVEYRPQPAADWQGLV